MTSGAARRAIARRRLGVVLVTCGVALVPWTVYLASTLPSRYTGRFYKESWTVFDVALLACLILTGVAVLRGSGRTSAAAAASGTLLFVDAWFDVSGSGARPDFWAAFLVALLIEIPLGIVCWRLALRTSGPVADPRGAAERLPRVRAGRRLQPPARTTAEETMSRPHDPLAGTGPVEERSGEDVAEGIERAEQGSGVREVHDGVGAVETAAGDREMTEGRVVRGEGAPSPPGAGVDPREAGSGGAQSAPGARMADREAAGEPLPGGPPFEHE